MNHGFYPNYVEIYGQCLAIISGSVTYREISLLEQAPGQIL